MYETGLLNRRRDGTSVYYSIADPLVFELCALMCRSTRAQTRIQLLRRARGHSSAAALDSAAGVVLNSPCHFIAPAVATRTRWRSAPSRNAYRPLPPPARTPAQHSQTLSDTLNGKFRATESAATYFQDRFSTLGSPVGESRGHNCLGVQMATSTPTSNSALELSYVTFAGTLTESGSSYEKVRAKPPNPRQSRSR